MIINLHLCTWTINWNLQRSYINEIHVSFPVAQNISKALYQSAKSNIILYVTTASHFTIGFNHHKGIPKKSLKYKYLLILLSDASRVWISVSSLRGRQSSSISSFKETSTHLICVAYPRNSFFWSGRVPWSLKYSDQFSIWTGQLHIMQEHRTHFKIYISVRYLSKSHWKLKETDGSWHILRSSRNPWLASCSGAKGTTRENTYSLGRPSLRNIFLC